MAHQVIDYTDALEASWIIFPLHGATGGQCHCGNEECKSILKHPVASNWQHTERYDEAQLAYLEDEDEIFKGNQLIDHYGVLVNKSGLIVVDVDGRNGGMESAQKLAHIREKCGFIVQSGSGYGEHWYFRLPAGDASYVTNLDEVKGIDFKTSGFVVGCGSQHASGHRYEVISGNPGQVTDAPQELLQMLVRKPREAFHVGEGHTVEFAELTRMVMAIPNDARDYEKWIRVGMGVHDATQGSADGMALWERWSEQNAAHDPTQIDYKWHSFGKCARPVTSGTIFTWAREAGYEVPVTFDSDQDFGDFEPVQDKPSFDLLNPPGLVGEIAQWINGRSIYPRKYLAVAAALQIVSNAASLRYRVAGLNTTLNLMTFCVAGSGTGKGIIQDCIKEAHGVIGITPATHGAFKSSQELIRNQLEHQLACYVIDEFGATLKKISNAGKSGAHYLEDLLARIMQITTEGNSVHLVTGDGKREMIDSEEKALAALFKISDSGKDVKDQIERQKTRIAEARMGIVNPMMTIFAASEPASFNEAIDSNPWLLVGGFLGRSLIFVEDDDAPDIKPPSQISSQGFPFEIELHRMFHAGHAGSSTGRIELAGDKALLHYTPEAEALLVGVHSYWADRAKQERDTGSNMTSLAMRAPELTIKVAGVLSVDDGEISRSNLAWAHEMVKMVTEEKIGRASSNEKLSSRNVKDKSDGLIEGVLRVLRRIEGGATVGIIRNQVGRSKISTEHVQAALDHLVDKGKARREEKRAKNNRVSVVYFSE